MIVGPRLRAGSSRSSGRRVGDGHGCRSLGRLLNLNPLLRSSKVVTSIPLVLGSGIRSASTNIGIRDQSLALGRRIGSIDMAVGQGSVGTSVDLCEACIRNSRVGLHQMRGLNRSVFGLCLLCAELSRVGGARQGGSLFLDGCVCRRSA